MFFLKKRQEEQTSNRRLLEFSDEIRELKKELDFVKDKLETLEIKALESRKIYAKKLKNLVSEDEKPNQEEFLNGAKVLNTNNT